MKKILCLFLVAALLVSCSTVEPTPGENVPEVPEEAYPIADTDSMGWHYEMVNAYRTLWEAMDSDERYSLRSTQVDFENGMGSQASFLRNRDNKQHDTHFYNALLYKLRTLELIDYYEELTEQPYSFLYPEPVEHGLYTFTSEDYDYMRQFANNYQPVGYQLSTDSFLDLDITGAVLESYVQNVLIEFAMFEPERDIKELSQENEFIFQASVHNTPKVINKYAKALGAGYTKECLSKTAKLLFGEEYDIDFDALEALKWRYEYDSYRGVAVAHNITSQANFPVVVDYEDMGDHYDIEVVFLPWSVKVPTLYYYWDDDHSYVELTEEEAKYYCQHILPRHKVVVRKGENGALYFVSKTKL